MKTSLRTVVIGGVVAGLMIPMAAATYYTSTALVKRLTAKNKADHTRTTEVLALGVQKALWDLSPESAAPLVDSIMGDERLLRTTIYDNKGAIFYEKKIPSRIPPEASTILKHETPIKNGDELIGKVEVDFSMASSVAEGADKISETLVVSLIQAMVCIGLVVLLVGSRVLKRIEKLKVQAQKIAAKELDHTFPWQATDEIGELGCSLESTRISLRDLFAEIEKKNVELAAMNDNLEQLVAMRTATIKMILENVQSGFFLVDQTLTVKEGYTKSCEKLLHQSNLAGQTLSQALKVNQRQAVHLNACVQQVFDDIFPEEVSLGQIPRRFNVDGSTVSLMGSVVKGAEGRTIEFILFTLVDVTDLDKTEQENRNNLAMIRILQNLVSFKDFVGESRDRIQNARSYLGQNDEKTVRRELHTLKGNSAAFGLEEIAHLVHDIEEKQKIQPDDLQWVQNALTEFLAKNYEFLKVSYEGNEPLPISIESKDLQDLLLQISQATHLTEALNLVERWTEQVSFEPAGQLLGPINDYVQKAAESLGKSVQLTIEGAHLKVNPTLVKPVAQNLIHALRNSIDHGLELPEHRENKPPQGQLKLKFSELPQEYQIILSDDGKGIDIEKVLNKAIQLGHINPAKVEHFPREKILDLIFLDGLSTAAAITETSGRGVGMSALRQAVISVGGTLKITSQPKIGTTITMSIPKKGARNQSKGVSSAKAA